MDLVEERKWDHGADASCWYPGVYLSTLQLYVGRNGSFHVKDKIEADHLAQQDGFDYSINIGKTEPAFNWRLYFRENIEIPKILYHGTSRAVAKGIEKTGLLIPQIGTTTRAWHKDASIPLVFAASSPDAPSLVWAMKDKTNDSSEWRIAVITDTSPFRYCDSERHHPIGCENGDFYSTVPVTIERFIKPTFHS